MALIFELKFMTFGIFYLLDRWYKVTFETCFMCTRCANFWLL